MLPWVFPSQGSSSPALTSISARLLPRASPGLRVTPRLGACATESQSAGVSPDQRGPGTPLRVFSPQHPWHGAAYLGPGYVFTLQVAPRYRGPSPPALWTEPGLPELSGLLIGDDQTPPFSSKWKIHRAESESTKIQLCVHSHSRKPRLRNPPAHLRFCAALARRARRWRKFSGLSRRIYFCHRVCRCA